MIAHSLILEEYNAETAHQRILKNYIYFGMAFPFTVEMLNMVMRKRMDNKRVMQLNEPVLTNDGENTSAQTKQTGRHDPGCFRS